MTRAVLWFDPVCPFCWMTSKWLRSVAEQRDLELEWRLVSLRLLNAHIDYDTHFPPEYEEGHNAGLRMLRVAAAVRDAEGNQGVDRLQLALGQVIFERPEGEVPREYVGTPAMVREVLDLAGLDAAYAEALDQEAWDEVTQRETDQALELTGKDVGTPIIQVDPPEGLSFFGPVISRLPAPDQAAELWDHVLGLARFPGFAELKRSLRERPQLPALGVDVDQAGITEDWHQGSRRQKK